MRHSYGDFKPRARRLRIYFCHANIVQRCTNDKTPVYKHYLGRGITLAEDLRWFPDFYDHVRSLPGWPADSDDLPSPLTIDRIDNNRPYEKGNLRIATRKDQASNRRSNRLETIGGRTMIFEDWCREVQIVHKETVRRRMDAGWSFQDAIFTPGRRGPKARKK